MGIQADFSGAFAKTRALKATPQAAKLQAQRWLSETRRDLQASAGAMKKSWAPGKAIGQMPRNIGQYIATTGTGWVLGVGTGLGGTQSVKYAKIQDEGGTTHPKVTERMRRWAWYMAYAGTGAQGEKMFRATFGHAARGMARLAGRQAKERSFGLYRAIALTKKPTLTVPIPASRWFTSIIDRREPVLREMMDPQVVYNVASQMTGGKG
jgi:hypothetical protein